MIWVSALGENGQPQELYKVAIVAQERVDAALKSGRFLQNSWETSAQFNKMLKVSEGLGKVIGYNKSISGSKEKIEKNYEALNQIYEARKVLENEDVIYNNPAGSAAAFDKVFMGFGTLAKQFPPPFDSTVGEFLFEFGSSGFFGGMTRLMFGEGSNAGRANGIGNGNYHGYDVNN